MGIRRQIIRRAKTASQWAERRFRGGSECHSKVVHLLQEAVASDNDLYM